MNGNFRNLWIGMAWHQVGSYRLANAAIQKGVETCLELGPEAIVESHLPRNEKTLNPMEFHGKRSTKRPARPHRKNG